MTVENLLKAVRRIVKNPLLILTPLVMVGPTPAAAAHDTLECEVPSNLQPLINLLHSFTELAFLAGVALAVLGYSIAGILLMMPGQDNSQRGKQVAKNVTFGVILLLSANMIVSFIVSEMGGVICG